jgi:hypothetical protein
MWSNITGAVGAALQHVQKIQSEIENQMDSAVGLEKKSSDSIEDASPLSVRTQSIVVANDAIQFINNDAQDKNLEVIVEISQQDNLETDSVSPSGHCNKYDDSKNPEDYYEHGVFKSKTSDAASINTSSDQENRSTALYEQKLAAIAQHHEEMLRTKLEEAKRESKFYYESQLKHQKELYEQDSKQQIEREKTLWKQNVENVEKTYQLMLQQLEEKYKSKIEQILENAEFTAAQTKVDDKENENLNDLKMQYDHLAVERAELSSTLKTLMDDNEKLKVLLQTAEKHLSELSLSKEAEIYALQMQVTELEECKKLLNNTKKVENDIDVLVKEKQQLILEIQQKNEIIVQRERALETVTQQYSYLQQECTEKESVIKHSQVANSAAGSTAKSEEELKKLHDLLKEKQMQLQEFEVEGRNLAKKQSEMEQKVRKSKSEMKEKDAEILKLKEHKESCMKTIESMQDLIRNKDIEVSNLQKTIVALQTVNQTASEKVTKLESEIISKNDELLNYKRSIENTWAENNEFRKLLNEKISEINELKKQLGENTSKVLETESTRRDVEQREAILRATSKQYQENLLQQMQEKASIEERLKSEVQEMRLRWQEAVEAREHLTTEIGQVTQPLLKEIQSLQEQLRNRVNFYQENERQLVEKLCRFETLQEQFEHKKLLYEENYSEIKGQLVDNKKLTQQLEQELLFQKQEKEKLTAKLESFVKEKHEFESIKVQEFLGRIQALQLEIQDMGMKHNSVVNMQLQQYENMSKEKDAMITQLQRDIKQLRESRMADMNLQHDTPKKPTISGKDDLEADFSGQLSMPSSSIDSNSKDCYLR